MSRTRKRKVNITPWDFKITYTHEGFIMTFSGTAVKANEEWEVRLHISFCWIEQIAQKLWQVVRERQDRINAVTKALKGE